MVFKSYKKMAVGACLAALALTCQAESRAQGSLFGSVLTAGNKAYRQGNFRDAQRLFEQALDLARRAQASEANRAGAGATMASFNLSSALVNLGATYAMLGKYHEAEDSIKQALQLSDERPASAISFLLPGHTQKAITLNNLAEVYAMQSHFAEAETMLEQAIKLAKGTKQGLYQSNLGDLYITWGKLDQAKVNVESSLAIFDNAKKRASQDYAYAAMRQGELAEALGQYGAAEQFYGDALQQAEKSLGPTHSYLAKGLFYLSRVYLKQSKYQKAEEALKRGKQILEQAYSPTHPEVAALLLEMAKLFQEEGRYSDAEKICTTARQMTESTVGHDNLQFADCLDTLASIYRYEGKYPEAKDLCTQSITIKETLVGRQNPEMAKSMSIEAQILADQGQITEAEAMFKDSLNISESTLGPSHPELASTIHAFANLYLKQRQYADAQPLYARSLAIAEKTYGPDNPVVADYLRDLGEVCASQRHFDEAETYLKRALATDEKVNPPKSPKIASDCDALASLYANEGKAPLAAPLEKRSAEIKGSIAGYSQTSDADTVQKLDALGKPLPSTDKWALIIGLSNFKDPSINLKFGAKDATDFKNFLVSAEGFKADHVLLLTDKDATRENIISKLGDGWLAKKASPSDLVLVYVSSHGSSATDEAGGVNFLVTYDTDKNSLLATGIPMQWLTKIVKEQVKSDRIIVFLDVCHSGSASGEKSLSRGAFAGFDGTKVSLGKGKMVLCSSAADQVSWESRNYQNSVFTRRLIEGLQSKGKKTDIKDAYKYLKTTVQEEVLRDRGSLQTPILSVGNWTGGEPLLGM